jgi:hypothetical protein
LASSNYIKHISQALEIAKLINLKKPILRILENSHQIMNEPNNLFYNGTIVLSKQINQIESLVRNLETEELEYNAILEKATYVDIISIPKAYFIFIGILFGFFFNCCNIFQTFIIKN